MKLWSYPIIHPVTLFVVVSLISSNVIFTNKTQASTVSKTLPDNFLGLVGWWTFDGPNMLSNVRDKSGQNNNGYLKLGASGNTATTTSSGRVGQALVFDGTDDYVRVPDDDTTLDFDTSDLSISLWYKRDVAGTGNRDFISKYASNSTGAGYKFRFTTNALTLLLDDDTDQATPQTNYTSYSTWNHVVVTVDRDVASGITFYINGTTSACTGNCSYTLTNIDTLLNTKAMCIGCRDGDDAGEYWMGNIDDVRMYSRVLSATEVKYLYNIGR